MIAVREWDDSLEFAMRSIADRNAGGKMLACVLANVEQVRNREHSHSLNRAVVLLAPGE